MPDLEQLQGKDASEGTIVQPGNVAKQRDQPLEPENRAWRLKEDNKLLQ